MTDCKGVEHNEKHNHSPLPIRRRRAALRSRRDRGYRQAFYYVLTTEAGEDLQLLVDSCRPELSQIDFTPWAFAPEPPWLAIMAPVRPVVEAWARARNLNVDWLIEDLLLALADTDGGLLPLVVESRLQAEERPPFMRVSVSVENWWHYSAMPRWAMRELLIDSCTKHIDAELDRIEQELEVAGVVKREGKRETKGTEKQRGADPSRHFRWLVRYQVLKEGYSEIAKTTKPRVDRGLSRRPCRERPT